tara:strand:+ start:192 stop:1061 length:870 start_codon:yes stop_codon:yes gene_type:complete
MSETNNGIVITVGNHPITRFDLIKEIKFIAVLSNININKSNREEIKNLAIQTLIKRSIKQNEIDRLKITNYNPKDLENQISSLSNNLGLDRNGFKTLLTENNLKYEDVIKGLEVDLKWNTAIFKLYKNKITLNTIEIEDKLNSELEKIKLDKTVLLSEIQVNVLAEGLEATTEKIFAKISQSGFENTAKELSISASSQNGGNIGWIKESKLSKEIYENIKNLKKGDIGKPISAGESIIFIKKIDERDTSAPDLETIKKRIVYQEKMKKLDMFSNSHYSDLERRTKVRFL